jgi:hypothetical protein
VPFVRVEPADLKDHCIVRFHALAFSDELPDPGIGLLLRRYYGAIDHFRGNVREERNACLCIPAIAYD